MRTVIRTALAFALVLVAIPLGAEAQERHTIRFESEAEELEVFVGPRHVCRTPCEHTLPAGARVQLSFAPPRAELPRNGRHTEGGLDPASFGDFDVLTSRTLRLRWVDHADLRLAGDVVLVVGVTLGALVGGTVLASSQGDDTLFGLGLGGLVLMGLSLIVGIPLAVWDNEVVEAR
ncbi:MAG: hypothetical protein H6719_21655 [Sandaracinaceae bacterium]|nr:hypothetical protein [Sandaracinaceae bacterium]